MVGLIKQGYCAEEDVNIHIWRILHGQNLRKRGVNHELL